MKNWMMGAGIGAVLCAGGVMANPVVSFVASSQHVNVGDTVTIDVSISGLGADILSAYDINVIYSSAVLNISAGNAGATVAQLGGAYGFPPSFVFDTILPGNIGMIAFAVADDATVAANQLDSFLLGSFIFAGLLDGVTTISLGTDLDFERSLVGAGALSLNALIGSVCIGVGTGQCTVPEPTSYALVGLGLFAAFAPTALRRRKTAA